MNEEKNNISEIEKKEVKLNKQQDEENNNKEASFFVKMLSNVIDQLVVLAMSGIVLVIFQFILKFIGYNILMPLGFLLIFYYIVNVLYSSIIGNTKGKKSIGQRVFNIG
ncbi:hypothetical protein UT300005_17210 [Clostridium sp. CTA-5]